MHQELISYRHGDADFDVHVVFPDETGPRPAVLVCHAWGGRDAFAEGKARALAELGYVGAAIDLYGVGRRGTDRASCEALMMALVSDPPLLRARLSAAFEQVRGLVAVDGERVGSIGFCFGGLCSLLLARMGLPLRACVSFHGLLKVGEPLESRPSAKMLVLHGQDDPMAPPSDVGAFAEEMKRVDGDWQLHVYPKTMHAFSNPDANDASFGTVYNEQAAKRSWAAMTHFLGDNL